jgi:hypothetical protein
MNGVFFAKVLAAKLGPDMGAKFIDGCEAVREFSVAGPRFCPARILQQGGIPGACIRRGE